MRFRMVIPKQKHTTNQRLVYLCTQLSYPIGFGQAKSTDEIRRLYGVPSPTPI